MDKLRNTIKRQGLIAIAALPILPSTNLAVALAYCKAEAQFLLVLGSGGEIEAAALKNLDAARMARRPAMSEEEIEAEWAAEFEAGKNSGEQK
jgi:hypothetical protein